MKIEDLYFPRPNKDVKEDDFDLEAWRKENPMDYLKAAFLLNQAIAPAVQAEVFKTIFQVTRLYIPNILYKYFPLKNNEESNEKRFQALMNGKMYLSAVKDFNDPFDSKAFFYNPEVLKKYDRLKSCGGRLVDDFSSFQRVAALTANGVHSMPMWAHYANNHTGFCVSYDMTDVQNNILRSCTFPVQYTEQRIAITCLMDSFVSNALKELERQKNAGKHEILIDDLSIVYLACLLCNIKHSSWSYEQEFRCSAGTNAAGMPFVDAKAKEIFIGIHCSPEHAKRLRKTGNDLSIPVHQMVFDETTETYQMKIE